MRKTGRVQSSQSQTVADAMCLGSPLLGCLLVGGSGEIDELGQLSQVDTPHDHLLLNFFLMLRLRDRRANGQKPWLIGPILFRELSKGLAFNADTAAGAIAMTRSCKRCDSSRWVCEAHPDQPRDSGATMRPCRCGAPGARRARTAIDLITRTPRGSRSNLTKEIPSSSIPEPSAFRSETPQ